MSTLERPVYVLAGEYSAPLDAEHPARVFEKARKVTQPGAELEALMYLAGERALRALALGDQGRLSVNRLLLTTMPDVGGNAIGHAIHLPNVLKRRLQLAEACQARFEIGSSDAGASLFASAVHLLRGLAEPSTALVVAGQVMPGGRDAIQTVAQVLDAPEREQGLTMLAVGDLLMDVQAWQWRQERQRRAYLAGLSVDEPVADGADPGAEAFDAAVEDAVSNKLALAAEYPAAQRADAARPADASAVSRWLTDWHIALASNGACAVVLTTDEALVRRWIGASGQRRVVRVLGVGEGDADPRLALRGEPFLFFKSVRQALVSLRRNTDTNHDFLRGAAFTVLHDAFPSIEHAFLLGLGFSPVEALSRARTYWPNPYGGLTAFGHALAASGLVQIAKAFHVFTRPDTYFPEDAVGASGRPGVHLDFTRAREPVHCLTTSVGGPLSHIVATLLESMPVGLDAGDAEVELPGPFEPKQRHRQNEPLVKDFETKTRWVALLASKYRRALAEHLPGLLGGTAGAGVVEARTHLDLRLVPWPLPAAFVSGATPADEALRDALTAPTLEAARTLIRSALSARGLTTEADERRLWERARVPVALVSGALPATDAARGVVWLTDAAAGCEIGDLICTDASGRVAVRVVSSDVAPGLVPVWYRGMVAHPVDHAPLMDALEAFDYLGPEDTLCATRPLDVLHRVVTQPLEPDVMSALQALGTRLIERVIARPTEAPSNGVLRLMHELVVHPEPSRWRIATALRLTLGLDDQAPAPPPEPMAYCEFDLLGAGDYTSGDLATRFATVADAIRRAEGWLAGSTVTHGRVGDAFATTVRSPPAPSLAWQTLLRFAYEVHQSCTRAGIGLRTAVCVGDGVAFPDVHNRFGIAGGLQKLAHLTLAQAPGFRRGGPEVRGAGLALVLADVANEASAATATERLWQGLLGAEADTLEVIARGPLDAAGPNTYIDIRRL